MKTEDEEYWSVRENKFISHLNIINCWFNVQHLMHFNFKVTNLVIEDVALACSKLHVKPRVYHIFVTRNSDFIVTNTRNA